MHTTDPDRRPAADFGVTTGDNRGRVHDWFTEDEQHAVTIIEGLDGEWTAALEDYSGDVL